jgi:hypothetical protein
MNNKPQPPPNVIFKESNTTGIPDGYVYNDQQPPPKPIPSPVRMVSDERGMMYLAIAVVAIIAAFLIGISI